MGRLVSIEGPIGGANRGPFVGPAAADRPDLRRPGGPGRRGAADGHTRGIDQYTLAQLIASGAYDRQLRQLRRRYRARRDALAGALARWLPGAVVHGVPAGIQLYVELPPGHDEADVVQAAAERGVAVEGVAPLRIAAGGPPALVLGFARLPEHRIAEAIRLLAEATTMTGPGRRRPGPHA
jgi:GntR family transcriptional regulator / MocR family aminotransferase